MVDFRGIDKSIYRNARRSLLRFYITSIRSCFPKKKFITSLYNQKILKIINNKNLINQINKMRNKEVILIKLERLEAEVKNVGYYIHKGDRETSYEKVGEVLESIGDIRTLLNTEHQD